MEAGRSLLDMGALLMELREQLGIPVDVVTENGIHERMRDRVLSEAVPLEDLK
jgi:predicted nucleotidyltransferase